MDNSCVWITVNRMCNLKCFWCYAQNVSGDHKDMSKELLFNLIDLCAEGGVKKIVFLGGEPTLYPHLYEAISYCKRLLIKVEITTNGVRLSDKTYLSGLISAGVNSIMVSIKGSNRNDFFHTTGKDEFSSIVSALEHLSNFHVTYGVSLVLTSSLIDNLETLIPLLIKTKIKILVFSFLFKYGDDGDSIMYLEQNNQDSILEQLYEKIIKYQADFDKINWIIESCSHIVNTNTRIYNVYKKRFHSSCKKHNSPISFDCSGNLLVCNNYPNLKIGKFGINFKTFKEMQEYVRFGND